MGVREGTEHKNQEIGTMKGGEKQSSFETISVPCVNLTSELCSSSGAHRATVPTPVLQQRSSNLSDPVV
eukprot:6200678-Pleurochrysis_carterae.AAC.6